MKKIFLVFLGGSLVITGYSTYNQNPALRQEAKEKQKLKAFTSAIENSVKKLWKTPPPTLEKQLIDSSLAGMTLIKGGTFIMGPTNSKLATSNNQPPHTVTLNSFYISKYNVSYGKFYQYMRINHFQTHQQNLDNIIQAPAYDVGIYALDNPVGDASWHQAHDYCAWLAKKTGLPYALPTEAQWEYVARNGGKESWIFPTNNGQQEIGKNWPTEKDYTMQEGNIGSAFVAMPVGSKPCLPNGVCGMAGQVTQWLEDWYSPDYYAHSPKHNPQGPKIGTKKVVRSGGAASSPEYETTFNRYGWKPNFHGGGFRCVINTDQPLPILKGKHRKPTP